MLNDYINKLISNTNNINYIIVGLGDKEYISQYIFDKFSSKTPNLNLLEPKSIIVE